MAAGRTLTILSTASKLYVLSTSISVIQGHAIPCRPILATVVPGVDMQYSHEPQGPIIFEHAVSWGEKFNHYICTHLGMYGEALGLMCGGN